MIKKELTGSLSQTRRRTNWGSAIKTSTKSIIIDVDLEGLVPQTISSKREFESEPSLPSTSAQIDYFTIESHMTESKFRSILFPTLFRIEQLTLSASPKDNPEARHDFLANSKMST